MVWSEDAAVSVCDLDMWIFIEVYKVVTVVVTLISHLCYLNTCFTKRIYDCTMTFLGRMLQLLFILEPFKELC